MLQLQETHNINPVRKYTGFISLVVVKFNNCDNTIPKTTCNILPNRWFIQSGLEIFKYSVVTFIFTFRCLKETITMDLVLGRCKLKKKYVSLFSVRCVVDAILECLIKSISA